MIHYLPPPPPNIVEGNIIHMMSLVDYESKFIRLRVLIEDVSFSQMGDLIDMIFFMTSMRWTYWMIVGCLAQISQR